MGLGAKKIRPFIMADIWFWWFYFSHFFLASFSRASLKG
jgi:hypothetical protein